MHMATFKNFVNNLIINTSISIECLDPQNTFSLKIIKKEQRNITVIINFSNYIYLITQSQDIPRQ